MMEKTTHRKIKAIWDFRGPASEQIAAHYRKHLEEFADLESMEYIHIGMEKFSPTHAIAYIVVPEAEVTRVRKQLKPHRGEVYTAENWLASHEK